MIKFNWLLGKDIVDMKAESKWGSSFFESLSNDLKKVFPNATGFTPGNLRYMKRFYLLFSNLICPQVGDKIVKNEIHPQVGDKIFSLPWGHLKLIIDKCNDKQNKAMFYVNASVKNSWSRAVLMNQISSNLYERQGKAITNFEYTLPPITSDLGELLGN